MAATPETPAPRPTLEELLVRGGLDAIANFYTSSELAEIILAEPDLIRRAEEASSFQETTDA